MCSASLLNRNSLKQRTKKAVELGLSYLLGKQDSMGAFQDFGSTGVPSREWITAHVCWVLEEIPQFKQASRRAAKYLVSHRNPTGIWGFNSVTATDFSSTSQVLMVLERQGIQVPSLAVLRLMKRTDPRGRLSHLSIPPRFTFQPLVVTP